MSDATVVIDASVAIKWVLNEPGRVAAISLLDDYEAARIDLVAPGVLMTEVASALAKRCRRRELTPARAEQAFRLLERRQPMAIDQPAHLRMAFSLALSHQVSVWDALYLALAIERRCDLVTADRRFHRSVARHYPFAKLLAETI